MLNLAIDGDGLRIELDGQVVAACERPLAVQIFADGQESWLFGGYAGSEETDGALVAWGEIAAGASRVAFRDAFSERDGRLLVRRRVEVRGDSAGVGFLTALRWQLPGAGFDDQWFAPGIWYGRNRYVPPYAIGSAEQRERSLAIWFREDRLPLPLLMHFDEKTGCAFSLLHVDGKPDTVVADDDDAALIDGRLGFGAFGLNADGGIGFAFPGAEGDSRYPPMWTLGVGNQQSDSPVNPFAGKAATRDYRGWNRRYHPLQDGFSQEYTLSIGAQRAESYQAAMRDIWRYAYAEYAPQVSPVDLAKVRQASMELLPRLIVRDEVGIGIPTWIDCFTGQPGKLQNNFGIGFVARNLEVAQLLLGQDATRALGLDIISFWVANAGHGLAHTEWSRPDQAWVDGGRVGDETQVFLRDESEAHRTLLHAWAEERERGHEHPDWLAWIVSYGDWLATNQGADGSFHRAYTVSGQPTHPGTADAAHVIPFLLDLGDVVGDERYAHVALAAAEYLWANYHRDGEYMGGTLDNPNCLDKEAAVLAMEAYLRLHEHGGDAKWLAAAQLAAQYCESWIFLWEIPMPLDDPDGRFFRGTTVGYQLITSGFSAFDMYLTRQIGDFLRLAELTGDAHYRELALILLHNTKTTVQLATEYGFPLPGLQIEHWSMGRGRGFGLNSGWLPWVTTSHIVGIDAAQAHGLIRRDYTTEDTEGDELRVLMV